MRNGKTIIQLAIGCWLATSLLILSGCGGGYTALEPGSEAPDLAVEGWIGEPPEIDGQVFVVEAFATW